MHCIINWSIKVCAGRCMLRSTRPSSGGVRGTSKRDNNDNRPCMYSTIVEVELKICVTFSVWPDVAL